MTTARLSRLFALLMIALLFLFLLNRYLAFWWGWPDLSAVIQHFFSENTLEGAALVKGLVLWLIYILTIVFLVRFERRRDDNGLLTDSDRYQRLTYFIVRAAFWSVFLVGLADAMVSLLRVEEMLSNWVGESAASVLNQARGRGIYLHYPLIVLALLIAWFTRGISFIWLAFLVVLSEFGIVLSRFIFSYEQAFMGDLVRFWYAALFLFGSAYTLVQGGHVRVDVLYAGFSQRAKARVNAWGTLLLGLPLCWTILLLGMGSRQGSLIAPVINFEISQSGYGMYVKYLMAAFLLIFALSMAIQFVSYFLKNMAVLTGELSEEEAAAQEQGAH